MTAVTVPAPLQAVAIIAAVAGLLWLSRRVEPHWVSKDGSRFTAKVQHLDDAGQRQSYWREVKATIDGTTVVLLARGLGNRVVIGGALTSPKSMLRRINPADDSASTLDKRIKPFARYEVDHRAATDTDGKAVFLLVGDDERSYLAIRVPTKSRAVQSLERLIVED